MFLAYLHGAGASRLCCCRHTCLERSSEASWYRVTNLMASVRAVWKPVWVAPCACMWWCVTIEAGSHRQAASPSNHAVSHVRTFGHKHVLADGAEVGADHGAGAE